MKETQDERITPQGQHPPRPYGAASASVAVKERVKFFKLDVEPIWIGNCENRIKRFTHVGATAGWIISAYPNIHARLPVTAFPVHRRLVRR